MLISCYWANTVLRTPAFRWASSIGENTAAVVRVFLTAHKVEQQGYKSCMALLKLSDHYSVVRLEDACRKALTFSPSPSLKSVQAILKSEQDLLQTEDVDPESVPQKAHRFTLSLIHISEPTRPY